MRSLTLASLSGLCASRRLPTRLKRLAFEKRPEPTPRRVARIKFSKTLRKPFEKTVRFIFPTAGRNCEARWLGNGKKLLDAVRVSFRRGDTFSLTQESSFQLPAASRVSPKFRVETFECVRRDSKRDSSERGCGKDLPLERRRGNERKKCHGYCFSAG